MNPIYSNGALVGYYDDLFQAYNANQDPIIANGVQALYDPTTNQLIDASGIGGTVDYTGGSTGGTVSQSAPPAGVASGDWMSLFADAAPKVINGIQAWQLAQINVQRAQKGLGPLNTALYATGQSGFMANMSSQTMLILAGLAAVFLIGGKKK